MFDEPFADPSQIPTFLVSRLVRSDREPSGDGGDELLAAMAPTDQREVLGDGKLPVSGRRMSPGYARLLSPEADGLFSGLGPLVLRRRDGRGPAARLRRSVPGLEETIYRSLISRWQSACW
jgi:asparagine synthase (glutamine-hydrolysing)